MISQASYVMEGEEGAKDETLDNNQQIKKRGCLTVAKQEPRERVRKQANSSCGREEGRSSQSKINL